MAIYTRDNINYGGMLQAALQNKARQIERDYDNYMKQPLAWSNALVNSGKIAQDTMFKIAGNYYDQDKIAQAQQFQASEAEKRALEAMERQKQQEEFQKAENALNRQNTMDIAKLNKDIAADEKKDEYQLHYQKAKSYYDMISKQADENKNNTELQRAKADAEWDLKYWAKKAGVTIATQSTPPKGETPEFGEDFLKEAGYKAETLKPEDKFDNSEITSNIDELLKVWTNANKAEAQDLVSKIQDPALKAKYEKIINNAGKTIEEQHAEASALKAAAQASYNALPKLANGSVKPGAFAKWKKANLKYAKALGK